MTCVNFLHFMLRISQLEPTSISNLCINPLVPSQCAQCVELLLIRLLSYDSANGCALLLATALWGVMSLVMALVMSLVLHYNFAPVFKTVILVFNPFLLLCLILRGYDIPLAGIVLMFCEAITNVNP